MSEQIRQARLDAIAATRAILAGDDGARDALLALTDDPRAMAHAACGFAASLLALMPADRREAILAGLTDAALGPDGERT